MKGYAQVLFNEDAYGEDIVRSGRKGAAVLREARRRYEDEGVAIADLRRCEEEGSDGTRLPACFKVYLPESDGRFGMVLRFTIAKKGAPRLRYLTFGVRHHPKGSHAETVYEIAHRRLHGD